jgi:hypothetical protein
MALSITCPHCSERVKAPESTIGRRVKCPKCQQAFVVNESLAVGDADPSTPSAAPPPNPFAALSPDEPAAPLALQPPASSLRPPQLLPQGSFQDFLFFRTMITPMLVQILFFVGSAICVLVGIGTFVVSLVGVLNMPNATSSVYLVVYGSLVGMGTAVLGPLLLRVQCELIVVFFRMYESLIELRRLQHDRQPPTE